MNELEIKEPKNELKFSESIDSETLDFIQLKTLRIGKLNRNYKCDLGKELKEVQERLSVKGYGCFGEWLEHINLSRNTAQNYIKLFEFMNVQPLYKQKELRALPEGLLYEVARPSAPAEAVEAVLNGDITTTKEFKDLKSQLHFAQKRADEAEESIVGMMKINSELQTKLKQGPKPEIKEVIKEVEKIPEDYSSTKAKYAHMKSEFDNLMDQRDSARKEVEALKQQQEIQKNSNLKLLEITTFNYYLGKFSREMASYLVMEEDFQRLDEREKRISLKTIERIEDQLTQLKYLITGQEIQEVIYE